MKVLLIDNKSAHLERLKKLIYEYIPHDAIRQIDTKEVDSQQIAWADLVIISGGQGRSIAKNPGTFGRMIKLVEAHNKPAIGICLGAEAIATYFGHAMTLMPVRRVGNVRLIPATHALGLPETGVWAYEFHKWKIEDNKDSELETLATSKDGIEIFRHKRYPIWGLQFHPEVKVRGNVGHYIFGMVLDELGLRADGAALLRKLRYKTELRDARKRKLVQKNAL